jgi:hypothetical protein
MALDVVETRISSVPAGYHDMAYLAATVQRSVATSLCDW